MKRRRPGTLLPEMFRSLVRRPATQPYPKVQIPVPEGFRGKIAVNPVLCIGCSLCAIVCPTLCIDMVPDAREVPFKGKTITRKKLPEVRLLDCIRCGLCEDACPTDPKAIFLTEKFSRAYTNKDAAVE